MTVIEEIVFEAINLGISDKLHKRVKKLSNKQEYRYVELQKIYEDALILEKEKLRNESGNT